MIVLCYYCLLYPLTNSLKSQLLWMMKEERKLSSLARRALRGCHLPLSGLSMSVAENLLDMEHTLNPSSHLGFYQSRHSLLSFVSICLSVCLMW